MDSKKRLWPRLLLYLIIGIIILIFLIILLTPDLTGLVTKQLKAMQEDQLTEAYYRYTSKGFQETHPYASFKQFVRTTPLLQHFTSVKISDINFKESTATLQADLIGGGSVDARVNYHFVKEDNQWKVAGMDVYEYDKPGTAMSTATLELISPVEAQLKSLQLRNFLAAYQMLTTEQFRNKTPFSKFKAFILEHPILTQFANYDFKNHFFDDGKGVVTVVLNPEKEASEVQYTLVKEGGSWKINLMKASLPEAKPVEVKDLLSVVENELNAIKAREFQRAYNDYLSDQLKSENSFDVFQVFVKKYPILLNFDSINILEPYIEENIGKVSVELIRDGETNTVDYILELEGGAWKISGMHLEAKPVGETVVENEETRQVKMREMVDLIHSFLEALKHGEYRQAYDQLTATNFKMNNTDKDLEFFVETHPDLLKSSASTFEKLIFNNNIATLTGYLALTNDKVIPVEFDLIEEEGKWKILHVFAMPVKDLAKANSTEGGVENKSGVNFPKLIIGSRINDEGLVMDPRSSLTQEISDIYLNLYVQNGKKDLPIEVSLRHVESGSSIPPVHAMLLQDGSSMVNLVFSPPSSGWPKGNYQIRVSAGDGIFKTFTFNVE